MVFITATESKLGQLAGFQEDATGQGLQKHRNSGAKETASCLNFLVNHFHGFLLVLTPAGGWLVLGWKYGNSGLRLQVCRS